METSELRIGNWINVKHPSEHESEGGMLYQLQVQGVDSYGVIETDAYGCIYGICDASINYVSGIPLTEEWLLKFGFTKRTYSSGHPEYHIHPSKYHSNINCLLFEDKLRVSIVNQSICTINFVHQLQNLYFALTGEELTLKK